MFTIEIVAAIGTDRPRVVECVTYMLANTAAAVQTARTLLDTVKSEQPDTTPDGAIITDQLTHAVLRYLEKTT